MENNEKNNQNQKKENNQAQQHIQKKEKQRRLKKEWRVFVFIVIIVASSNIILISLRTIYRLHWYIQDVDRRENGHTFICMMEISELFQHTVRYAGQIKFKGHEDQHKIIEIDENGEVVWELEGLGFPHEVEELPNGHLLIADAYYDRVIEVNYPDKDIVWEWNAREINWEKINPDWGSEHYYNNPINFAFTHINDVDYKLYDNYSACLISIREFNLIVEVNYTAEKTDRENDPDNIIWYYGDYEDKTLLNHQHNPDYLDNGNILIADSGNNRVIEVDYKEKEVVWEYHEGLHWPRDADDLGDGTILITDAQNNRIIKIDKEKKTVLWSHETDLIIPYEADQLDDDVILVGNGHAGTVLEIKSNGAEKVLYGTDFLKITFYINGFLVIGFDSYGIINLYKRERGKTFSALTPREKKKKIALLTGYICLFLAVISIFFIYNHIFTLIIYPIFRPFMGIIELEVIPA